MNFILNMSTTSEYFFKRQKRDLIDKSTRIDKRKEAKESILNVSYHSVKMKRILFNKE